MNGYSNFTILGTVASDVTTKKLENGTLRATFSVAVNLPYLDKNADKWEERTAWFNLAQFGKRAESSSKRLQKGMHVMVSGQILSRIQEIDGKKYTLYVFQPDVVRPVTYASQHAENGVFRKDRQGQPSVESAERRAGPALVRDDEPPGVPMDDTPVSEDDLLF